MSIADANKRVRADLIDLGKNIDPHCLSFLESGIAGGSRSIFNQYFNALTGASGGTPLAGAADFSGTQFAGLNGMANDYAFGYAITINSSGAFFSGAVGVGYADKFASDMNKLVGGTPPAQNFILLHELAHYFQANGFNPNDTGSVAAQKMNNDLIWKNCANTIQGGLL